jgi:plastocyanin
MKKIMAMMALMAFAGLALAACGGGSGGSSSSSDTSSSSSGSSSSSKSASSGGGYGSGSSSSTKTTAASSSSSSAREGEIKVNMIDDAFQPKVITGKAGSTVKVELKNTGAREHNFKIDSQKQADADVEPGEDATVSVKIPSSGTVQFYCEYHKGLGMVGTLKAS